MEIIIHIDSPFKQREKTCIVEDVIELESEMAEEFAGNLLRGFDIIGYQADRLWKQDTGLHCLLVLCEGESDGFLINRAGENHVVNFATVPGARVLMEHHMSEIANTMVVKGLIHSIDGGYRVPNSWFEKNDAPLVLKSEYMRQLLEDTLLDHRAVECAEKTGQGFALGLDKELCQNLGPGFRPRQQRLRFVDLLKPGLERFCLNVADPEYQFTPAIAPGMTLDTLTAAGRREWENVLSAPVDGIRCEEIATDEHGLVVDLDTPHVLQVMYLGNLLAGNCTQEQQNQWVEYPLAPANGYEWPHDLGTEDGPTMGGM